MTSKVLGATETYGSTNPIEPETVTLPITVAASSLNYQVRAGDTLSAIALLHDVSLKELVNVNHLTTPDWLQINQRLTIPGQGAISRQRVVGSQTIATNNAVIEAQSKETLKTAVMVPNLPSAVSEPTVVVPSVSKSYLVEAGDTLSAIALSHDVSLNKLVSANHLTTPDQLQINQRLTIPAHSSTVNQTIAVIKHPIHPWVTASNVGATLPLSAASGIGGGVSDDESSSNRKPAQLRAAKPEKPPSNPYVQNLQTDIQMLQQKYYAQLPANQPTNPEFRSKQKLETLKLAIQKSRSIQAKFPVQPKTGAATLPIGVDAPESPRLRQVSPDLPPLAAVDTYLPKPFDNSVYKGYIWPTKGALTSGYGWRWGRMHKGIDIAAPIGTPVVAAAPGVVIKAGWNSGGYGRLVDIKHADGTFTRYAHNNRILVQPGQQVEQGQLISEMGSTGHSTGPHLHFEIHPAGKGAVNPVAFLRRE